MIVHSIPYFLLGIMLIALFAVTWAFFPVGSGYTLGESPEFSLKGLYTLAKHAFLPALSLVAVAAGGWAIVLRSMMVIVQGEDYVQMSKAMGLKSWRVFYSHQVRNALLPQVTFLALSMGIIFTGAVMVEIVFSYPGIGYLLQQAIIGNDSNTVQSIVITTAFIFAVLLATMETVYPLIDRRIGRA